MWFLICAWASTALFAPVFARADKMVERTNAILPKMEIIAGDVAYCRIGSVADGVAAETRAAYRELSATATNKIKGVILDLRFADGDDCSAAAATADLFVSKERPLLDWGNGIAKSTPKKDAISAPLTVLINGETRGAAEVLAAVLRGVDDGLLIGNATAGWTNVTVKIGNGAELSQVQPDISVNVSLADERERFDNPYMVTLKSNPTNSMTVTNRAWVAIERLSEADLVRARQNGNNLNDLEDNPIVPIRSTEPQPPVIRDPVLARAVDFIKGLEALRMRF